MTRPTGVASPEGIPFFLTRRLGDNDFLRGHAYYLPFKVLGEKTGETKLFNSKGTAIELEANLSPKSLNYLAKLGITDFQNDSVADLIWMHVLAVGFSPEYLAENATGIRNDWPRIPMPMSKNLLLSSATLGRKIAALLDSDSVEGVTTGRIRKELSQIATLAKKDGRAVDLSAGDLDLTAEWGHLGKDGAIMPGPGRIVTREYSTNELAAFEDSLSSLGVTLQELKKILGSRMVDVYLNNNVFWRGIPENVWHTTIGGYQVIKKWLSYRERKILGRGLNVVEVREVTDIARRVASILMMYPSLNKNYSLAKDSAQSWFEPSNE